MQGGSLPTGMVVHFHGSFKKTVRKKRPFCRRPEILWTSAGVGLGSNPALSPKTGSPVYSSIGVRMVVSVKYPLKV